MPRKKKEETLSPAVPKTSPKPKKISAKTVRKPAKPVEKISRVKKTAEAKPKKTTGLPKALTPHKNPANSQGAASWKRLPRHGGTQMVAFIRDPRCLFTYWEVAPETVEDVKKQLMEEYKDSSMVLMLFRTGSHGEAEFLYEIKVEPGEKNRYLELKEPGGRFFVQIAQKTASGRIIPYAKSNIVATDAGFASPVSTDPQWETPSALLEYFSDEENPEHPFVAPWGISSAEQQKRKKSKEARYSASRIN